MTGIGLDPVADQQLAGLIMWIPGGLVHGVAAIACSTNGSRPRRTDHAPSLSTKASFAHPRGGPGRRRVIGVIVEYAHERTQLRMHAAATTGGDPRRGEAMFIQYGCGSCHALEDVRTATGMVGPPLDGIALARDHRRPPRQHARQHAALDPRPAAGLARHRHARPQCRRDGRARHHRLPLHPREMISAAGSRSTRCAEWRARSSRRRRSRPSPARRSDFRRGATS